MFQRVGCKRRVANGEGAVRSARGGRAPHRKMGVSPVRFEFDLKIRYSRARRPCHYGVF